MRWWTSSAPLKRATCTRSARTPASFVAWCMATTTFAPWATSAWCWFTNVLSAEPIPRLYRDRSALGAQAGEALIERGERRLRRSGPTERLGRRHVALFYEVEHALG